MTQTDPLPTEEDYRRYDAIWRRVSPEYNPYPEAREGMEKDMEVRGNLMSLPANENAEPGAPDGLEKLRGFLREELADGQIYRSMLRLGVGRAAQSTIRSIAAAEENHARQLQAAHFLITGERYRITVCLAPLHKTTLCEALRERYHTEVCGGFNYEQAAEAVRDRSLGKLYRQLSEEEYRHAERLRFLLSGLL